MFQRLAASFAEDSSDEECIDTPDKDNIDAKKETAQKQNKEDGANRKSIFIRNVCDNLQFFKVTKYAGEIHIFNN